MFFLAAIIFLLLFAVFLVFRKKASVRRVVTMSAAYIVACLVAGFSFMPLVIVSHHLAYSYAPLTTPLPGFLIYGSLISGFTFVIALVPASLVVWYAEQAKMRSPIFYAITGSVIGCVGFLFGGGAAGGFFAASGALAGLTYWAIAGRNAGA